MPRTSTRLLGLGWLSDFNFLKDFEIFPALARSAVFHRLLSEVPGLLCSRKCIDKSAVASYGKMLLFYIVLTNLSSYYKA